MQFYCWLVFGCVISKRDKQKVTSAVFVRVKGTVKLGVTVSPGSGKFEICEHDSVVVSGRISILEEPDIPDNECAKPVESTEPLPLNSEDIYKELRLRGYEYGPTFRGILSADGTGKIYICNVITVTHSFDSVGWMTEKERHLVRGKFCCNSSSIRKVD